jgi:hypothetical protein
MTIECLRRELAEIEQSARFQGRPYPIGIEPFPRALAGQGFFPGGDGLWRRDTPEALRQRSPYAFPQNGIMYLGNDFGSLAGFQRLKLHENPPTWRWLRMRLLAGGIAGEIGFYTNAYLGLRGDRSALAHPIANPDYSSLCAEYLGTQVRYQSPRLIVVLGQRPFGLLAKLMNFPDGQSGLLRRGTFEGRDFGIIVVSHPYSDVGKTALARQAEGEILANAWAAVR